MGQITYNFAGIKTAEGELLAAVSRTLGLLDEGKGSLANLQAAWLGQGSDSYQAVQMRWDQNSEELNLALQNLAQAVGGAGDTMAQTEQGVVGKFA